MGRIDIPYFDGLNGLVSSNMFKVTELMHAENACSPMIGTMQKRNGMLDLGKAVGGGPFTATDNEGIFYFSNLGSGNTGLYRISTVGASTSIYYLKTNNEWTPLTGGGTGLTAATIFDTAIGEDCIFLVNGTDNNRYIKTSDGTTVLDSTSTVGHLYNTPKANIINYYKGKVYLADYTSNSVRYKTTILRSSNLCGILALVNNDVLSGSTTIEVTDVKYIYTAAPGNTLDVYRGNTLITTITVTSIQENTITVNALGVGLQSADELWVAGTFTGAKVFRWAYNPTTTGTTVKEYDTFKLPGNGNEEIKLMSNINNMMVIANNSSLAVWNDYVLQSFDSGNGCVSKTGWVKNLGTLYYIHYSGVYATVGGAPQLISSKVEPYIAGATKAGLEATAAGKQGKSIYFAIGDVTLYNPDGSIKKVLSQVLLEYSITQQNWFVHTGVSATQFATYIESTNADRCMFINRTTGFPVTEFSVGTDDNGKAIPFRADTANICLNKEFETVSYPTEIALEMERGSQMKCFISLDMGNYYELEGEAIKGATVFKVTPEDGDKSSPARCRNLRVSLREYSGQLCKVSKMSIIYSSSKEYEQQKPDDSK